MPKPKMMGYLDSMKLMFPNASPLDVAKWTAKDAALKEEEEYKERMARNAVSHAIDDLLSTAASALEDARNIVKLREKFPDLKRSGTLYYSEAINDNIEEIELFTGQTWELRCFQHTPSGRIYCDPPIIKLGHCERVDIDEWGPLGEESFVMIGDGDDAVPAWKFEIQRYGIKLKPEHYAQIQQAIDDDKYIRDAHED